MPEGPSGDRTEKATPKKREQARKKGQVARSREIPSVLILMTGLGIFYFGGAWIFMNLRALIGGIYQNLSSMPMNEIADASRLAREVFGQLITILVPIFLPIAIAGLAGNIAQIGFEIHADPMKLSLAKLNPVSGVKRLVSLKSLVELTKSLIKICFVGLIAYLVVRNEMKLFPSLMQREVVDILRILGQVAFKIIFFVCLALIVLAVLDYIYQRWQYERNLMMTKQEVKDERKQSEGDPKIKARIRSMQLKMAQLRMMEAVPEADVVITNPTHLAVALKFDGQTMIAPRVLAKGAGFIAEQIKELAREYNVPIVEDKLLAQTLHKMVEIGDYIPVELYRAVAEILAYVYRLKGKIRAA